MAIAEEVGRSLTREELVKRYFRPTPSRPAPDPFITPLVMGGGATFIACIAFVLVTSFDPIKVALLVTALGVVALMMVLLGLVRYGDHKYRFDAYRTARSHAEPKPTDEQMNTWLREDLRRIIEYGGQRLSVHAGERRDVLELIGRGMRPRSITSRTSTGSIPRAK